MAEISFLIDSTTIVPRELLTTGELTMIPIPIHAGAREYRDGVDLSSAEFLDLLASSKARPSTAVPGLGEFSSYYDGLLRDCRIVIYPIASRKLSGLFNAAVQAARHVEGAHVVAVDAPVDDDTGVHILQSSDPQLGARLPELLALQGPVIVVLNTDLVSGATGLLTIEGLRAVRRGLPWTEVLAHMVSTKRATGMLFVLRTLDYVVDRVGTLKAFIGGLLRIRPILEVRDGLVVDVARVRSESQAIAQLVALVKHRVGDMPLRAYFLHADAEPQAHQLAELARGELNIVEEYLGDCGATVGRYTGRGGLGIAFSPFVSDP